MAMIRDPHQLSKSHSIEATIACSIWKFYDNPFYHSPRKNNFGANLTFFPSVIMDSELDIARARITELRAELELERKARKKAESLNKKLTKELYQAMTGREAIENICEKLAEEIALDKAETNRMKREMEEERKMLRMAEVLREERVQMKLTEVKLLFEEKISELEFSKVAIVQVEEASLLMKQEEDGIGSRAVCTSTTDINDSPLIMGPYEKSASFNINSAGSTLRSTSSKRRGSQEAENPHIKRGIKGFVEFPRVVRAISSRGRQLG